MDNNPTPGKGFREHIRKVDDICLWAPFYKRVEENLLNGWTPGIWNIPDNCTGRNLPTRYLPPQNRGLTQLRLLVDGNSKDLI